MFDYISDILSIIMFTFDYDDAPANLFVIITISAYEKSLTIDITL